MIAVYSIARDARERAEPRLGAADMRSGRREQLRSARPAHTRDRVRRGAAWSVLAGIIVPIYCRNTSRLQSAIFPSRTFARRSTVQPCLSK